MVYTLLQLNLQYHFRSSLLGSFENDTPCTLRCVIAQSLQPLFLQRLKVVLTEDFSALTAYMYIFFAIYPHSTGYQPTPGSLVSSLSVLVAKVAWCPVCLALAATSLQLQCRQNHKGSWDQLGFSGRTNNFVPPGSTSGVHNHLSVATQCDEHCWGWAFINSIPVWRSSPMAISAYNWRHREDSAVQPAEVQARGGAWSDFSSAVPSV